MQGPLVFVGVLVLSTAVAMAAVVAPAASRVAEGDEHFRAGRYVEAERSWLLALRMQPAYLKAKAAQQLRLRRWSEAIELVDRLRTVAPDDVDGIELAGRAYLAAGDVDRGKGLLRLALHRNTDAVTARLLLAGAALDGGEIDEAAALLQHPLPAEAAEVKVLRGRLALARHDATAAVEQLGLAVKLDPSSTEARYHLALAHLAAGQPKAALAVIDEATTLLPDNQAFQLARVRALLALHPGSTNEIRERLRSLVGRGAPNVAAEARLLLVTLLEEAGSHEEALQLCLDAGTGNGKAPRSLVVKASNLYMKVAADREARGAQQKADMAFARSIELLQQALSDDPSEQATRALLTERYIELGEHYFKKGKAVDQPRLKQQLFGYAIFNLERAVELDPKTDNRAHHLLGQVLNHLERHEEAIQHFDRIKGELSHFVESIYSYGESCLKLRKFLDASTAFTRVVRIRPDHWRAHRDLGLTYWHLQSSTKAEASFKQALALHTDDPCPWFYLGKIRLGQRQYADATTCLTKVVELTIPPLRDRPEDIPVLAHHFLERFAERFATGPVEVTRELEARLLAHRWPGNVRELENAMESLLALSLDGELDLSLLPGGAQADKGEALGRSATLKERTEAYERGLIATALQSMSGNRTEAAKVLGISRATLHEKLKKYKLE